MSIFRKVELAVFLVLILGLVVIGVHNWTLRQSLKSAQQDYQLSEGNSQAHETAAKGTKRVMSEEKAAHEELDKAYESNKEWADEPLPTDISDVLREHPSSAR